MACCLIVALLLVLSGRLLDLHPHLHRKFLSYPSKRASCLANPYQGCHQRCRLVLHTRRRCKIRLTPYDMIMSFRDVKNVNAFATEDFQGCRYLLADGLSMLPGSDSCTGHVLRCMCCLQGAVCTGIWVIAHECGHQAFSKYQLVNDSVGLVMHSCLLVPYFSW